MKSINYPQRFCLLFGKSGMNLPTNETFRKTNSLKALINTCST